MNIAAIIRVLDVSLWFGPMTDAIVIAFVAAMPPTLVALTGVIVSLRNSKKADDIHVLVNSNLTSVKADLALANARIIKLEELLMKRNQ